MPLYQYRCKGCDRKFDIFFSYENSHNIRCPSCGAAAQRLISCPNLITDTSFAWQGIKDRRLGDRPIENRKDFESRLAEKGLAVADKSEMDSMFVDNEVSMGNIEL